VTAELHGGTHPPRAIHLTIRTLRGVPNVLSYRSPKQNDGAPSADFRAAYERERGRWLRRRILWYIGICLVMGLLSLTLSFNTGKVTLKSQKWLETVYAVNMLTAVIVYAAAMVWAWRAKARYRTLLNAAVWFYLLTSLWACGLSYYTQGVMSLESESQFVSGLEEGVRNASTRSTTSAATTAPASTAANTPIGTISINGKTQPLRLGMLGDLWSFGIVWLMIVFGFFFNHLLICLFLPWTLRESIRPTVCLIAFGVLLLACDLVARPLLPGRPVFFGVTTAFIVTCFVPGALICWFRFSRFNKHFRLQFESQGYRKLQGDLEGARRIHEAALPPKRAAGPVRIDYCYEPAQQIGGDMVFVHPHDPRDAAATTLVALDVTGHGIAAALTLNRVMGEIERTMTERPDTSPAQLIDNLNRYMHFTASRHAVFMTALAVRIPHDSSGTVEFVNAGHPTGFVVRAATGEIESMSSNAMMLGCATGPDFECEPGALSLAPRDVAILYTDGWSEAATPAGVQLGTAGVRAMIERIAKSTLPVEQWCEALMAEIRAHREGEPQDDTLIVAAWRA
jgi:serine phosphatase RsbU (regulator of sigma subunit)